MDINGFKSAFAGTVGKQSKRIQDLEDEVKSWKTGIDLVQEELDGIIAEGTLDAETEARAEAMFQQLDERIAEAIAGLETALAELED
jgi:hypothetical protein